MCRMMCFRTATIKESQEIVAAFRNQAHESAPDPEDNQRTHPDGWGIVAFAPENVRFIARRPEDAAHDPYYERALDMMRGAPKGAAFLCHLRRSSSGTKKLDNTHPFVADGWAFAHNGTIEGHLDDPGVPYAGDTDSERFFRKLLKHIRAQANFETALRRCVAEIEAHSRFTSLTFLATNGTTVYGYVRSGTDFRGTRTKEQMQAYYTLGWGKRGKTLVVAQEPTHLGGFETWNTVADDALLTWTPGSDPQVTPMGLVAAAATNE